jgi:hypothetical protein
MCLSGIIIHRLAFDGWNSAFGVALVIIIPNIMRGAFAIKYLPLV